MNNKEVELRKEEFLEDLELNGVYNNSRFYRKGKKANNPVSALPPY